MSPPPQKVDVYAPVFAKYVLSDYSKDDSDAASSFLHLVIAYVQDLGPRVAYEIKREFLGAAEIVAGRQAYYDADSDRLLDLAANPTEADSVAELRSQRISFKLAEDRTVVRFR